MWEVPDPGDIVWCRFPEHPNYVPGPKPRPVLVLTVAEFPETVVTVIYGTSQKIDHLFAGEFAIRNADNSVAFRLSGLSRDTKFNVRKQITLPWNDSFFSVPPKAPHGQTPKLGSLHMPSLGRALQAALQAPAQ